MSYPGTNPYAAPQAPVPAMLADGGGQFTGGVWRQGNLLVMHRTAVLPARCVKTNEPTQGRLRRKLYWHHPAIYLALLLNIIIYAVLASVLSHRATIEIGLSETGFSRRRKVMLISWIGVLLGIGAFVSSFFADWNAGPTGPLVMFSGLGLFLVFLIFGLIAARMVQAKKMDHHYIWLSGVNREYLDQLPVFPYA
ncbi:MAG: hypothetical protein U0935_01345 [Pirellulales bacterium]